MKRYELGSNEHGAPDLVAYDHGDYVTFDDHDAEVQRLNARIAELEAQVARYPKTEDGVTIYPGMTVHGGLCHGPHIVSGFDVTTSGKLTCIYFRDGGFDAIVCRYYSTQQAAEAAKGET